MSPQTLASLLPLPVAIPIAGAVLAPLGARVNRHLPIVLCTTTMLGSLAVLGLLAPDVYRGRILTQFMGRWVPIGGHALGIALAADPFGLTFALLVAFVGTLLLVSALSELGGLGPRELGAFFCLFQLLLAALIGSALTADLFDLFVWFEVAALASYGLTGFFLERPIALEAAFKILVLTTIASFAVFLGAALLYQDHGALNYGQLHGALGSALHTSDLVALGLLVAGFATKAGLMPFHGWLADAHTAAPGPVSALFSGLMVNMGILAIARLALQVYGAPQTRPLLHLLIALGAISALLGAVLALAQDDLKRLLAYDTVSQMGVLAVGLGTGSAGGVGGMVYHLVNHALFKALLFLCAGAILHATGASRLSEMGGLARRMPAIAGAFVLGVLAIAGIPPLNGYVSLGLIHDALEKSGDLAALATVLLAQCVTVAALSRAAYLAFFHTRRRAARVERVRPGMVVALAGLGAACVTFGILAQPILHDVIAPAASSLVAGPGYAHAAIDAAGGRIVQVRVGFSYLAPSDWLLALATTLVGLALAALYVRIREPIPITWLRRLHNGSVNDYATMAVAGALVTMLVLVVR